MQGKNFIKEIRNLIARDDLSSAIRLLKDFLENSPKLDEVIHQSGRFFDIRKQIRLGLVSHQDATMAHNHIRVGLIDLVRELEEQSKNPELNQELERAISVMNSKNVFTNSSFNVGGNLNLGDQNELNVKGDQNIVIQGLTNSSINLNVSLPPELLQNLLQDKVLTSNDKLWVKNLQGDLLKQGNVSVGNAPLEVFQHYGWLIQTFLYKLCTDVGSKANLRRLSFMAETYQGALRYLCFIQMAQILQSGEIHKHALFTDFLFMEDDKYLTFDYLSLLLLSTDTLPKESCFMPELHGFVNKVNNPQTALHKAALYLKEVRLNILENKIPNDEKLGLLLDEYLTALVFWLRKLAFLAKYRLISIKDINLDYRIGMTSKFKHQYGELHGFYSNIPGEMNYKARLVEGGFTYNHSVLLFKGNNIEACMQNLHKPGTYLSLSPLLIDQSVLMETPKQTPELYYYIGQDSSPRKYCFAHYQNELPFHNYDPQRSNKVLIIGFQNNEHPRLDDMYEHLEIVFDPT